MSPLQEECRPTCYSHRQPRSVVLTSGCIFNLSQCQETIDDLAKDDMLAIQKITRLTGEEELTSVCVGTRVGLNTAEEVNKNAE